MNQPTAGAGQATPTPIVAQAREHPLAFHNGDTRLIGALSVPATPGPHPAVVLIHGAGPADRTYHGFFIPLHAHLLRHGIAVLWYDKPGIANPAQPDGEHSTGDWRDQDMRERAAEVLAAVQAAQACADVDPRRVGVLGYSQGWWAVAQAAAQSRQIAFSICLGGASVSPAAQEAYRVEQELRVDGYTDDQIARALAVLERGIRAAQHGEPFDTIAGELRRVSDEPWYRYLHFPEDERLWRFLSRMVTHDPLPDILRLCCPVLVLYGERDTRLPVRVSAALFQELLGAHDDRDLTIAFFPNADHFMFDHLANVHTTGYLETIVAWIKERTALL